MDFCAFITPSETIGALWLGCDRLSPEKFVLTVSYYNTNVEAGTPMDGKAVKIIRKIVDFYSRHRLPFLIVAGYLVLALVTGILGSWNVGKVLEGELLEGGQGRVLVVLLHGLVGDKDKMNAVKAEVIKNEAYSGADFYQPQYTANALSNADPLKVSERLEEKIHQFHTRVDYSEIVLIGHSMGDLLVRKAYMLGAENGAPWTEEVTRIVSLAGINRGWSVNSKVENPDRLKRLIWRMGKFIGMITPSGGMVEQLEKGAPFIANLRVQWMRHISESEETGRQVPLVVQIIGDNDDVVSREDSLDLLVSRQFHSFLVSGPAHGDLVDFSSDEFGEQLQRTFSMALTQDSFQGNERGYIRSECNEAGSICRKTEVDKSITDVIMVRHGIRDFGDWGTEFKRFYEERYPQNTHVFIEPSSYVRMPLFPFLLFNSREQRVNEFMDDYTQLKAKYPEAERVHFVGHSNGTYLLARALEKYEEMQISRVVFAGTVTPRQYGWRNLINIRVDEVLNFVGTDDLVVGVFPRFFEFIHEIFGLKGWNFERLGSAGFAGYHYRGEGMYRIDGSGGHGWAVNADHYTTMATFINEGGSTLAISNSSERPTHAVLLSNLSWLVWGLLGLVVFGLWKLAVWCGRLWTEKARGPSYAPILTGTGFLVVVAMLLVSI